MLFLKNGNVSNLELIDTEQDIFDSQQDIFDSQQDIFDSQQDIFDSQQDIPQAQSVSYCHTRHVREGRKVNRIAGDSNSHRIKDILPDDIAVKCLPISDENM
ncbi:hypothetical protein DPMN_047467 [Dreissena polymorpha]|uniref:Uncharacterized protein n=1 Tax=Dreissena polymorpha TaxID=45954 RepID=A0A9D4I349_DREPO|nr:hypothetical protein DPMN_047467 [Dreissena polymorpha]